MQSEAKQNTLKLAFGIHRGPSAAPAKLLLIPEIAKDFGFSASTLAKAVSGISWAHLPGAVRHD